MNPRHAFGRSPLLAVVLVLALAGAVSAQEPPEHERAARAMGKRILTEYPPAVRETLSTFLEQNHADRLRELLEVFRQDRDRATEELRDLVADAANQLGIPPAARPPAEGRDERRPNAPRLDGDPAEPGPPLRRPIPGWDPASSFQELLREAIGRLPEEHREALMGFIRENLQPELEELATLARRHLEAARREAPRFLEQAYALFRQGGDSEAMKRHRRSRDLERRLENLAEQYRRAADGDRAVLRAEMEKAAAEAFEVKLQQLEAESQEVEQQAARLRALAEKRRENRQAIIDRRLEELTGEADYLRW